MIHLLTFGHSYDWDDPVKTFNFLLLSYLPLVGSRGFTLFKFQYFYGARRFRVSLLNFSKLFKLRK